MKIGFGVVVESCWVDLMNLTDLVNPHILSQPVYEPGRPIEDVARELGLNPGTIIKLASNENSLGTSPLALNAMRQALEKCGPFELPALLGLRFDKAKLGAR